MSDVKEISKTTKDDQGTGAPKKTQSKKPTTSAKLELVLVGQFSSDYDKTVTREAVQSSGEWYADTKDFTDLATQGKHGAPQILSTIGNWMSFLESRDEGSVRRIDILTHGERESIAFQGRIFAPRGEKRADIRIADARGDILTTPFIDVLLLDELMLEREEADRFVRIRRSFAKGGEIHLYACRAGSTGLLPAKMAKVFGVRVSAFTLDLRFRRTKTKLLVHVGDSAEVADYRNLDKVATKYVVTRDP
jgi:hypothetical protein